MIVADTSALLSLTAGGVVETVLDEFDVHTTKRIIEELEETAAYDDEHGAAARTVLEYRERLTVRGVAEPDVTSTRTDAGEASCVALVDECDADFLVTDDLRALPELQALADTKVAISPIVLRALVERGVLDGSDARDRLETVAKRRDWLGAPIFRRAETLFEDLDDE